MKTREEVPFILKFTLTVSLLGLLTLPLMIVYPSRTSVDFVLRRQMVGSILVLMCAGGTIAALTPRRCSGSFSTHTRSPALRIESKTDSSIGSKGHHPDCGRFSAHTVLLGGKLYCAACCGLVAGAAVAVAMAVLYFFFGFGMDELEFLSVPIGALGLLLGFIQFKFKGWARLSANMLFVFGSSLMLIGMDQHTGSLFVDLYVLGLATFWILTRIAISQWDHSRICRTCDHRCRR